MSPNEKSEERDSEAGKSDKGVPVNTLAGETGDDVADHTEAGHDHDVHRRVRVEPEHVLEQDGISAEVGIKNPNPEHVLQGHQQECDRNHRRAQDHDDAGGVLGPDEKRQPEPGHARCPHLVDGGQEVDTREDGREAVDEYASESQRHVEAGVSAAIGRIEGPSRIDAAHDYGDCGQGAASHETVPAQKVDLGKRHIPSADLDWQEEVPQYSRHGRNEEEEDHRHAMHGKQLVIRRGFDHIRLGSQQLESNESRENSSDYEEDGRHNQIEYADALVVEGQKPGLDAIAGVQVVHPSAVGWGGDCCVGCHLLPICLPLDPTRNHSATEYS